MRNEQFPRGFLAPVNKLSKGYPVIKFFKDYLTRLNVPWSDECCPDEGTPGGGGGGNFATSDLSLTGDRLQDGAGFGFRMSDLSSLEFDSTGPMTLNALGDFVLNSDISLFGSTSETQMISGGPISISSTTSPIGITTPQAVNITSDTLIYAGSYVEILATEVIIARKVKIGWDGGDGSQHDFGLTLPFMIQGNPNSVPAFGMIMYDLGAGMASICNTALQGWMPIATIKLTDDFVDDATAAAGNVPIGQLYHTAGAVKIRLT